MRGRDRAIGDRVTFCVRPEHLRFADDAGGPNRLTAAVAGREFLGERTRVHLDWDGVPLTVRVGKFEGSTGDRVTVAFDPADARLLD